MRDISEILPPLWPHCPPDLMSGALDSWDAVTQEYEINTDLRVIHALTQFSAESDGGRITHESLNYTHAERLRQVWPRRFRDKSDAELMHLLHDPEALAEAVYSGRMGNERPGDGGKYLGRGWLQTTGKEAYKQLGDIIGVDLVANPDALIAPENILRCAVADFVKICKCLPDADADNLLHVSALVNVGHIVNDPSSINGWDNRNIWHAKVVEAVNA